MQLQNVASEGMQLEDVAADSMQIKEVASEGMQLGKVAAEGTQLGEVEVAEGTQLEEEEAAEGMQLEEEAAEGMQIKAVAMQKKATTQVGRFAQSSNAQRKNKKFEEAAFNRAVEQAMRDLASLGLGDTTTLEDQVSSWNAHRHSQLAAARAMNAKDGVDKGQVGRHMLQEVHELLQSGASDSHAGNTEDMDREPDTTTLEGLIANFNVMETTSFELNVTAWVCSVDRFREIKQLVRQIPDITADWKDEDRVQLLMESLSTVMDVAAAKYNTTSSSSTDVPVGPWPGMNLTWQNPMEEKPATESECGEAQSTVAPEKDGEIIASYAADTGKVSLTKGDPYYTVKEAEEATLEFSQACANHQHKQWVLGTIPNIQGDEASMRAFAAEHIPEGVPFLLGRSGHVPELFVAYRCDPKDRHKPKVTQGLQCITTSKGGNQSMKIIKTLQTAIATSLSVLSNLTIENEKGEEDNIASGLQYEEALAKVLDWGTERFTAFVQNAIHAKHRKAALSELQVVCMLCKAPMLEVIKLRQDADDMVFHLQSAKHIAACPLDYDDGATYAAKWLKLAHWDPDAKKFHIMTLEAWLNSEEHLLSSLLLLGEGGLGKSKLAHMLAQELCVAYDKTQYVFGKSIDALGILSYAGCIRMSGCLCLTDFEFKAARGYAQEIYSNHVGAEHVENEIVTCPIGPTWSRMRDK